LSLFTTNGHEARFISYNKMEKKDTFLFLKINMYARRSANENQKRERYITSSSRSFSCSLVQARALSQARFAKERERERCLSSLFQTLEFYSFYFFVLFFW
jgi:hypothetical protein